MNEKPPTKLGAPGLRLWKSIVAKYQLREDEFRVLEHACRTHTLIDKLQKDLDKSNLTAHGSMGQLVAHPFLSEIRQQRNVFKQLIGKIDFPEEAAKSGERGTKAREAANQRWRRSG